MTEFLVLTICVQLRVLEIEQDRPIRLPLALAAATAFLVLAPQLLLLVELVG